jgi:hypothetical protein
MPIPADIETRLSNAFAAEAQLPIEQADRKKAQAEAALKAQEVTNLNLVLAEREATIVQLNKRIGELEQRPEPEPSGGEGWTPLLRRAEAKEFFVSTSGADANDGSQAKPFKTLRKAYDSVVGGRGDHVRLKAGDVWAEAFPVWGKSGHSAAHPVVVTCYGMGTVLPTIRPLHGDGTQGVSHVAFVGINFYDARRDPDSPAFDPVTARLQTSGIAWHHGGTGLLVEGCTFFWLWKGLDVAPFAGNRGRRLDGVVVRRNVIAYSYSLNGHSQGIYANTGGGDVVITDNVFHHNGWSRHPKLLEFKDAAGKPVVASTVYNHGVYLDESCGPNSDTSRNVVSASSSHGIQLRPGGKCNDNLIVDCAIATAGADSPVVCDDNVVLRGRDIEGASDPSRGYGIWFDKCPHLTMRRNVVANKTPLTGKYGAAFFLEYISEKGFNAGTVRPVPDNVVIVGEGNVVHNWGSSGGAIRPRMLKGSFTWKDSVVNDAGATAVFETAGAFGSAAVVKTLTGNRYSTKRSAPETFILDGVKKSFDGWKAATGDNATFVATSLVDPTRDEGDYNASLGGARTTDAFMAECLKQSRLNWREAYTASKANAYIREGFKVA